MAINFPEDWLITALEPKRVAFRSLKQHWGVDNITLFTKPADKDSILTDYHEEALSKFRADKAVTLLEDSFTTLGGVPAFTIKYTVPDRLRVLNQGQQTIALTEQGVLVTLTTLVAQDKLADYEPIFDLVLERMMC